ncbi:hypothetical protein EVAR_9048_1 [Eumeta japonica]|uniref:Uncharacterized protein n=1 Tax=Eumeta variegata TaxID=151549 RepID=A0A4C1TX23_EUMVA|nr:hypothetical protein EVAR_9048_1 [Eumeta japonica]
MLKVDGQEVEGSRRWSTTAVGALRWQMRTSTEVVYKYLYLRQITLLDRSSFGKDVAQKTQPYKCYGNYSVCSIFIDLAANLSLCPTFNSDSVIVSDRGHDVDSFGPILDFVSNPVFDVHPDTGSEFACFAVHFESAFGHVSD